MKVGWPGARQTGRPGLGRALTGLGARCTSGPASEAASLRSGSPAVVVIDAAPLEDDVSELSELVGRLAPDARVAVLSLGKPIASPGEGRREHDQRFLKPASQQQLRELLSARAVGLSPARLSDAVPASTELLNLRVLLAEDNVINTKLARRILEKMGCQVTHAENGIQAVDLWAAEAVDLILMDVQMPMMDGLEATRTIRAREPAGVRVPIIALTANAMKGDDDACMAAGMDGYVPKPIDRRLLEQAMRHALRGRIEARV